MTTRNIKSVESPMPARGFLGTGHLAVPVIDGSHFVDTDPFILLMDDQLDLPGTEPVGGPHPHAGFETVTLVLEGDPQSNEKTLQTGGLEWMTAGSGIIHTEEIRQAVKLRILQLWLVLPKAQRWTKPKWQELHLDNVPVKKDGNSEIRVYSGTGMGMQAPTHNETPTTVVDFKLEQGYEVVQELPGNYNAFIYVIEGSVSVGEDQAIVGKGQVGWLDKSESGGPSQVIFKAGAAGARFILYAGEPQGEEIVSHGPFIGDTTADITRLYQDFRQGKMKHVRELPPEQIIRHL